MTRSTLSNHRDIVSEQQYQFRLFSVPRFVTFQRTGLIRDSKHTFVDERSSFFDFSKKNEQKHTFYLDEIQNGIRIEIKKS